MPFLPHLPTTRVAEAAADPRAVVLLPVASIEQHGPHLPLFTDTTIAEAIVGAVDDGELPVWTLPAIAYGKSNEHVLFPGTVTVSAETLLRVLDEISASLVRAGFSRLAVLNTHGGNTALLSVAARDIRVRHGLAVAVLNPNPLANLVERRAVEIEPDEARYGIHAGRVETSVMLAVAPELVDMGAAEGEPPDLLKKSDHLGFAGPQSVAWLASDLAENGVLGDPSGATAEEGRLLFEESVRITKEAIGEFLDLDFPERSPE